MSEISELLELRELAEEVEAQGKSIRKKAENFNIVAHVLGRNSEAMHSTVLAYLFSYNAKEVRLLSDFCRWLREELDREYPEGNEKAELFRKAKDFFASFSQEDEISVAREKDNVDIYIETKQKVLLIENKVWASDQPQQIRRYYEAAKRKGKEVFVLYLTMHEDRDPGKQSRGDLKEGEHYYSIDYKSHIIPWLESLGREGSGYPAAVTRGVENYVNLLKGFYQNKHMEEGIEAIVNALLEEKNRSIVRVISKYNVIGTVADRLQHKFYTELKENLHDSESWEGKLPQIFYKKLILFENKRASKRLILGGKEYLCRPAVKMSTYSTSAVKDLVGCAWAQMDANVANHVLSYLREKIDGDGFGVYHTNPAWELRVWKRFFPDHINVSSPDLFHRILDNEERQSLLDGAVSQINAFYDAWQQVKEDDLSAYVNEKLKENS